MDQKPKTRSSPKKIAKPKAKDEKQFERFIETAREIEAEDSQKKFESAFTRITALSRALKS